MAKTYIRIRSGKFAVCSDYFYDSGLEALCIRLEANHHPKKNKTPEVTALLRDGFVTSPDLVFPVGTGFRTRDEKLAFWNDLKNRPGDLMDWGLTMDA